VSGKKKVMLINVTHSEESRVAILNDGVLEAFEIETFDHRSQKGDIYKAKVESAHPGLQAGFVDIGGRKDAFLPLDEVNFALHPPRKDLPRGRLENHLHKGQELLVQVVRDAFGTKPPTVSTYFSLPGRFLVLTPYVKTIGISRKLEDKQRERQRKAIESLKLPEEHGVIVRTAGASATKTDLGRDLRYLLRLWEKIESAAGKVRAPKLVYQERSLVIRAIRDLFSPDVDELLVDDRAIYEEINEFFETVAPHRQRIVKLYEGDRPLFNKYNLEEQIENIFRRRVPLPSGGALVFDTTEALTSVDVNSSKMRREGHIEDTALKANLEAADEIARQLRLRDLGGLIVIDFIDMRSRKNIRDVEKRMRDALKPDKARYDVTRISSLGLMEISRERVAAEKSSLRYTDCKVCSGTGKIKTIEAAAMQALRRLQTRVVRGDLENVELLLPPEVAEYLLNQKRAELVGWEERYRTRIVIKGDPRIGQDEVEVRAVVREKAPEQAPIVAHPTRGEVLAADEAAEAEEEPAADAGAEAGAEAEGETAASGSRRKRRRRRRRKPAAERTEADEQPEAAEASAQAEPASDAAPQPDQSAPAEEAAAEEAAAADAGDDSGDGEGTAAEGASRRRRRRRRRRRKPAAAEQEQPAGAATATAAPEPDHLAAEGVAPLTPWATVAPLEEAGVERPRPAWWKRIVEQGAR
jgi:ribonuclease E